MTRRDHHDGVSRFEKKERGFTAGKTHFLGVLDVVAAHTVNAVHGELLASPCDRDRHRRSGGKNKAHG